MAAAGSDREAGGVTRCRPAIGPAFAAIMAALPSMRIGFLGDPVWWAVGLAGLVADVALRAIAPAALSGSVLHGAAQWFSCVLWQPVIEEIAFRGMVQGELLRTRWGARRIGHLTAANAATSIAFMAMHFVHHPPLWAASVFVPSLIFGWLRERYGGVGAPIGIHVLFNLEFFSAASLIIS